MSDGVPAASMTDPVVATPEEEVLDGQQPAVEVSLEAKPTTPVAATPSTPSVDTTLQSELQSIKNRLSASQRINERMQRELDAMKAQPAAPAFEPKDELEKMLFSNDPAKVREAIRLQANQEARAILQAERQQVALQAEQHQRQQTLSDAQQNVIKKYPDLHPDSGNPDSAISRAYAEVLSQDPYLLTNPYGPLVAMQRMEERLTETAKATGNIRRATGSLPPSRPTAATGTITLSRDQKAFCDRHGLDYAVYAKNLNTLATQGGVEV